jgi:hypothetical protein
VIRGERPPWRIDLGGRTGSSASPRFPTLLAGTPAILGPFHPRFRAISTSKSGRSTPFSGDFDLNFRVRSGSFPGVMPPSGVPLSILGSGRIRWFTRSDDPHVGMPSSTVCVVFEPGPADPRRTRSVADGISTEDRGNELWVATYPWMRCVLAGGGRIRGTMPEPAWQSSRMRRCVGPKQAGRPIGDS